MASPIQWMTPPSLDAALAGGEYVLESGTGGLQWMTPLGTYVNEQPVAGGATRPVKMAGRWGGYAGSSGGFAG